MDIAITVSTNGIPRYTTALCGQWPHNADRGYVQLRRPRLCVSGSVVVVVVVVVARRTFDLNDESALTVNELKIDVGAPF